MKGQHITLSGAIGFRTRVLLSLLSHKSISIHNIRVENAAEIGLREYEIDFLKCMSQMTDGTSVEINESGTSFKLSPGITNGGNLTFDCGTEKPIGYFLEMLIPLALFAKNPVTVTLTGITQSSKDAPSVDAIKTVNFGILRAWGIKDPALDIKIIKRGYFPNGGGKVIFTAPILKTSFEPRQFTDPGLIKRVRGIASCSKVSPSIATRIIDSSKQMLNKLLPDALIHSDARKGAEAGLSPGYSLTLVGESTTKSLVVAEGQAEPGEVPEEFSTRITTEFISKLAILSWGDVSRQWFILLLAVLSTEDVTSVQLSSPTKFTLEFLRDIYIFFGVTFRLKEDPASETVVASCVGTGFKNISFRSS